jgi:hypothetical protein
VPAFSIWTTIALTCLPSKASTAYSSSRAIRSTCSARAKRYWITRNRRACSMLYIWAHVAGTTLRSLKLGDVGNSGTGRKVYLKSIGARPVNFPFGPQVSFLEARLPIIAARDFGGDPPRMSVWKAGFATGRGRCSDSGNARVIARAFSGTSRAASALVAHDQREGWRSRSVREHAQSGTNRCLARMAGRRPLNPGFRTCSTPR